MKNESVNQLAEVASRACMRGAVDYLRIHNLHATPEALADCCRSWAKIKLPEALHDAKEAIACNMAQVAEQTFVATMIQAGIEAAKECGMPRA